jgi:hypothetical protein
MDLGCGKKEWSCDRDNVREGVARRVDGTRVMSTLWVVVGSFCIFHAKKQKVRGGIGEPAAPLYAGRG